MKLIIRNLDRQTTEHELKGLFQKFGAIQYCTVVMDAETGKSKGFAFIEMPKAGEAKAAMKEMNYQTVGENKIRVKKAETKKDLGAE